MRTIKQVSDLTGISVRMLHYYDKIGLLKPSELTDTGYRLYDDKALEALQQILFFKEFELPLKEVKEIMTSPHFDKMKVLENQKILLILKRNKLNDLIELISKTIKGENTMSFKEFDMTEYFNALEELKNEHKDEIIKGYGSLEKYNEHIEKIKSNQVTTDKIAKMAIKKYGSIEKFVKAMKNNFNNSVANNMAEQIDKFKKDCLYDKHPQLTELYIKLTADLSKDPSSEQIQQIAREITTIAKRDYEVFKNELGDNYWLTMVRLYSTFPKELENVDKQHGGIGMSWVDKKYGEGAAKFIGKALEIYLGDYEPKIEILYKNLTSDLSKDPTSVEIQAIVKELISESNKQSEILKVDEGENKWSYQSELYLSDSIYIKVMDKKYGNGAAKFIGQALKIYCEKEK